MGFNLKYIFLLFLIVDFSQVDFVYSAPLRHTILEPDTLESLQSQRGCFSYFSSLHRGLCVPTDYLLNDGQVKFSFLLKADDESYKIFDRFSQKKIDEKFVAKLFKEDNFQSAAGSVKVQAIYRKTSFTYTPVNFSGAFKLINPSLPEVHVSGYTQQVLRVRQNFYFRNIFKIADLLVSPSLFYYKRTFFNSDFNILDTVGGKLKDLVKKKAKKGVDADLSFYWFWKRPWLPSFGVAIENMTAAEFCEDCQERFIDVESAFLNNFRFFFSNYIDHAIGKSIFSLMLPLYNLNGDKEYSSEMSYGYNYRLSKLDMMTSFSSFMFSFGFSYTSGLYRVGLQYTNEKQDNSIQIDRQKRTYVYTDFFL